MSYKPDYSSGNWKTVCDDCGRIYKSFQLQMRWDGVMVCYQCWEPRQPQDFVRGVADKIVPAWTRPEQADTFIFPVCNLITSQGMADIGTADCMRADINEGLFPQCTVQGSLAFAGTAVAGCMVAGMLSPGLNFFPFVNS